MANIDINPDLTLVNDLWVSLDRGMMTWEEVLDSIAKYLMDYISNYEKEEIRNETNKKDRHSLIEAHIYDHFDECMYNTLVYIRSIYALFATIGFDQDLIDASKKDGYTLTDITTYCLHNYLLNAGDKKQLLIRAMDNLICNDIEKYRMQIRLDTHRGYSAIFTLTYDLKDEDTWKIKPVICHGLDMSNYNVLYKGDENSFGQGEFTKEIKEIIDNVNHGLFELAYKRYKQLAYKLLDKAVSEYMIELGTVFGNFN